MEEALVKVTLGLLIALEAWPDDEIDPDTAVKLMEDIAATVYGLDPVDQARFVSIGQRWAAATDKDRANSAVPAYGDAIRQALAGFDFEASDDAH